MSVCVCVCVCMCVCVCVCVCVSVRVLCHCSRIIKPPHLVAGVGAAADEADLELGGPVVLLDGILELQGFVRKGDEAS